MDNLETLYNNLRTKDYEHFFTDKHLPFHTYLTYYDKEFASRKKNVKLLEIGVSWGGSLILWTKYFNKYKLEGLDISDSFLRTEGNPNEKVLAEDKNVNLHLNVSSTDIDYARNNFKDGYFDFIVEDGAHDVANQFETFKLYFPKLSKKGAYYIEDVLGKNAVESLTTLIKEHTGDVVDIDVYEGNIGRMDDIILKITRK
jgi:cyclopropane fatty-acyl-phospholipid synthase-like methyltransferase